MGTTSDKLTYLNTTKTKIKDAINLANTSITNETFRLYEEKIKQAIINTMLDKWKVWDNFDKVNGSGTGLTLNNTHKAPLKLDLNENTYQYSTTGKNLLNYYNLMSTATNVGLAINNNGELYDTSPTGDNRGWGYNASNWQLSLNSGTYQITMIFSTKCTTNSGALRVYKSDGTLLGGDTSNITNKNNYTLPITLTETTDIGVMIKIYDGVAKVQIEKSNSATEWEPYTGESPAPSPSYPFDIHNVSGDNTIEICGKNLFDFENLSSQYAYVSSTGEIVNSTQNRLYDFIKTKPNTQYRLSTKDTNYGLTIVEYDTNKTFIQRTPANNASSNTITTSATTEYVRLFFNKDNSSTTTTEYVESQKPQLEIGTTTTYEAYTGNSQLISLGVENLFDKNTMVLSGANINTGTNKIASISSSTTIYIPCKPRTTYTISKTLTSRFAWGTTQSQPAVDVSVEDIGQNNNLTQKTITTNANAKYIVVWAYTTTYDTTPLQDVLDSIQIEVGSKANSYSEYGKEPIEYCGIGDYKNKFIRTSGKNLFDKDNANILNASIQSTITSSSNAKTLYISIKGDTTYTISKILSSRLRIGTTTEIPQLNVSVSQQLANDTGTSITITTDSQAKYLCVYYFLNETDTLTEQQVLDSIQIEKNNQATEYNPFGSDEWYLKEEIVKVVLDGTQEPSLLETLTTVSRYVFNNLINAIGKSQCISNYFTWRSSQAENGTFNNGDNEGIHIRDDGKGIGLKINTSTASTTTALKTWLSTHNTIVYYVLATPTYTKITDYTLLSQLEAIYNAISMQGVTNILQENNDLPFNIDASAIKEYE